MLALTKLENSQTALSSKSQELFESKSLTEKSKMYTQLLDAVGQVFLSQKSVLSILNENIPQISSESLQIFHEYLTTSEQTIRLLIDRIPSNSKPYYQKFEKLANKRTQIDKLVHEVDNASDYISSYKTLQTALLDTSTLLLDHEQLKLELIKPSGGGYDIRLLVERIKQLGDVAIPVLTRNNGSAVWDSISQEEWTGLNEGEAHAFAMLNSITQHLSDFQVEEPMEEIKIERKPVKALQHNKRQGLRSGRPARSDPQISEDPDETSTTPSPVRQSTPKASDDSEIARKKLKETEMLLAELQRKLDKMGEENSQIKQKVRSSEITIPRLQKQVEESGEKVLQLTSQNDELQKKADQLEDELRKQKRMSNNFGRTAKESEETLKKLTDENEDLKAENARKVKNLRNLEAEIERLKKLIEDLQNEISSQSNTQDDRIKELRSKLETANKEIERLLEEQNQFQARLELLEKQVEEKDQMLGEQNIQLMNVNGQVKQLEEENSNLEEEVKRRDAQIADLQGKCRQLDENIAQLRKNLLEKNEADGDDYKALLKEIDDLNKKIEQLEGEIAARNSRIEEMLHASHLLQSNLNDANENLQIKDSQYQHLQQTTAKEIQDLKKLIEDLQSKLKTNTYTINSLEDDLNRLYEEISEKDKEILRLREINSKPPIVPNLMIPRSNTYQDRLKHFYTLLNKNIYINLSRALYNWRLDSTQFSLVSSPVSRVRFSTQSSGAFDFQSPRNSELVRMDVVEEALKQEDDATLQDNILMQSYYEQKYEIEQPMQDDEVMTLIESMLDAKYSDDIELLNLRKRPLSIQQFVFEFLNRMYGQQKLALAHFGQLMSGLNTLYNQGNAYGILYCRLLQIYHPSPVPYMCGLYLTKVRVHFQNLINTTGEKNKYLEVGIARLYDVLGLVQHLFEKDKKSGVLAMHLLKPDKVESDNYGAFLIAFHAERQNKSPEEIFDKLLGVNNGEISVGEFVPSLRLQLDFWVPEERARTLAESISVNNQVKRDTFIQAIQTAQQKFDHASYCISKCQFLSCMIEIYHARQTRDAAYLTSQFQKYGPPLFKEGFIELLQDLKPGITQEEIDKYYEEALDLSSNPVEGVSSHALCRVALRNSIGGMGLGVFLIEELAGMIEDGDADLIEGRGSPQGTRHSMFSRFSYDKGDSTGLHEEEIITTVTKRKRRVIKRKKKTSSP